MLKILMSIYNLVFLYFLKKLILKELQIFNFVSVSCFYNNNYLIPFDSGNDSVNFNKMI